ncbi:sigma-70 family RNA polymerase sigma factor [Prevotella sp. PCHR]|uniref:RNA polymerase sigma factor n=1 Tax=Xylanibacter caecicola TaxID=2736294 RepID=A0ABX2B2D5_9BACT|nr:sigma-70 family RNA polymerase sigma factor [Xylanibacter caecicola]NPE25679.1 sigma-70 family RNA polymerase sigma factor [Xylanibacter caecicola]
MEENKDSIIVGLLSDKKNYRRAFDMIVREYGESLYWKIRHFVLYHEDADDVLQNTFMKAWKNLDSFHGKSKLSTWLFSIAINESLNHVGKKKREEEAMSGVSVAEKLVADDYFDGDKAQALLYEAVSLLPDVQRTVFNLRYFDEMKYSEMSRMLSTSEGALKASYHIAVKKIHDYLAEKGDFAV